AALRQLLAPLSFLAHEIDAVECLRGGEVQFLRVWARDDAFDVSRFGELARVGGDALDELVPVFDVEDKNARAAEFEVIANAGAHDVEQPRGAGLRFGVYGEGRGE